MRRVLVVIANLILVLGIIYAIGPRPEFEELDPTPLTLDLTIDQVQQYIIDRDARITDLKAGNETKLHWYDTDSKEKTEYVVLYLHGFSASGEEGSEIHESYAKAIGANLYIPRLIDSGRKSKDTFKGLTPKKMLDSAREAIAVAKLLGDKIILVSCSTGGTYGAYLGGYDNAIVAQIMLSPNIDLYDTTSELVIMPWGRELLNIIQGSEYHKVPHYTDEQKKYWNESYHNDGIVALKSLLNMTMRTEHFEKIDHPVMLMVYNKNEEEQDKVISIDRMRDFYNEISTPETGKRFVDCAICQNHVIGNRTFNTNTDYVLEQVLDFTKDVLNIGLKPI